VLCDVDAKDRAPSLLASPNRPVDSASLSPFCGRFCRRMELPLRGVSARLYVEKKFTSSRIRRSSSVRSFRQASSVHATLWHASCAHTLPFPWDPPAEKGNIDKSRHFRKVATRENEEYQQAAFNKTRMSSGFQCNPCALVPPAASASERVGWVGWVKDKGEYATLPSHLAAHQPAHLRAKLRGSCVVERHEQLRAERAEGGFFHPHIQPFAVAVFHHTQLHDALVHLHTRASILFNRQCPLHSMSPDIEKSPEVIWLVSSMYIAASSIRGTLHKQQLQDMCKERAKVPNQPKKNHRRKKGA
jgi:hypothetical protein